MLECCFQASFRIWTRERKFKPHVRCKSSFATYTCNCPHWRCTDKLREITLRRNLLFSCFLECILMKLLCSEVSQHNSYFCVSSLCFTMLRLKWLIFIFHTDLIIVRWFCRMIKCFWTFNSGDSFSDFRQWRHKAFDRAATIIYDD